MINVIPRLTESILTHMVTSFLAQLPLEGKNSQQVTFSYMIILLRIYGIIHQYFNLLENSIKIPRVSAKNVFSTLIVWVVVEFN